MNLEMIKGKKKYFGECLNALFGSELGKVYFKNKEEAGKTLHRIVENEKWVVAIENKSKFLGFICYLEKGVFSGFPYIHLFIIAENVRDRGYGNKVLDSFEELMRTNSSKLFLLVGNFNSMAKRFYEKRGYMQMGAIPGLYKNDVTEYLMMKSLKDNIA